MSMNKVGIAAYGITPFTKDDKKIESILLESAKNLLENNSKIEKNEMIQCLDVPNTKTAQRGLPV